MLRLKVARIFASSNALIKGAWMRSCRLKMACFLIPLTRVLMFDIALASKLDEAKKEAVEIRRATILKKLEDKTNKLQQAIDSRGHDLSKKIQCAVERNSTAIQLANDLKKVFEEYQKGFKSNYFPGSSSQSSAEADDYMLLGWVKLLNSYDQDAEPLLNRFLKNPSVYEKAAKFKTLIDYGIDVNGTDSKGVPRSIQYASSEEFPLKLIIEASQEEIGSLEVRTELFRLLFLRPNFRILRFINDQSKPLGIERTLLEYGNQHEVLQRLVTYDLYEMFSLMIQELSTNRTDIVILDKISDRLNNIKDAFDSPLLSYLAEKMMYLWNFYPLDGDEHLFERFYDSAIHKNPQVSSKIGVLAQIKHFGVKDAEGNLVDRHKDPFSAQVVTELQRDAHGIFERYFAVDARVGDRRRFRLQDASHICDFYRLGRYRNRLLEYLNSVTLRLTDNGPSDPTKMVRFFEKNEGNDHSQMNMIFWGKEIVFNKQNSQWHNPTMFSAFYRNAETVRLLLAKVDVDVSHTDSVHMNIFHLAFPLSNLLHIKYNQKQDFGYEAEDLAGVVAVLGNKGADIETAAYETISGLLYRPARDGLAAEEIRRQNIKALTQLSDYGKTPLALAAQFGFSRCYKIMKDYLLENRRFKATDHRFEKKTLEEVMFQGLKARLDSGTVSQVYQNELNRECQEFKVQADVQSKYQMPLADFEDERDPTYPYTKFLIEKMDKWLNPKHPEGMTGEVADVLSVAWSQLRYDLENPEMTLFGKTYGDKDGSALVGDHAKFSNKLLHSHFFENFKKSTFEVQWSYLAGPFRRGVKYFLDNQVIEDMCFTPELIADLFTVVSPEVRILDASSVAPPYHPVEKNKHIWQMMRREAKEILIDFDRLETEEEENTGGGINPFEAAVGAEDASGQDRGGLSGDEWF